MRIGYVHVLPLEYYPPARNALVHLASIDQWLLRAWTSANRRNLPQWTESAVTLRRPAHPDARTALPLRMLGYGGWHLRTAAELAGWRPDAIIAVEPHSALAVWLYYRLFAGSASLFIHHHEYYAPEDFDAPGMRVLRATRRLEQRDLFPRALWVSQTNDERLRLLLSWNPAIRKSAAMVLPNYPPREWIAKAQGVPRSAPSSRLRLIYLGSASFRDTFIREVATWAAERTSSVSLHVCGDNVDPRVWTWLASLGASNITSNTGGISYDDLPELLTQFDVGLVLYKGNTLNFVHNVPNKAIEYLACGLDVWYPREMVAMRGFHSRFADLPLREIDFRAMPDSELLPSRTRHSSEEFPFTCEAAMTPLVAALRLVEKKT